MTDIESVNSQRMLPEKSAGDLDADLVGGRMDGVGAGRDGGRHRKRAADRHRAQRQQAFLLGVGFIILGFRVYWIVAPPLQMRKDEDRTCRAQELRRPFDRVPGICCERITPRQHHQKAHGRCCLVQHVAGDETLPPDLFLLKDFGTLRDVGLQGRGQYCSRSNHKASQ